MSRKITIEAWRSCRASTAAIAWLLIVGSVGADDQLGPEPRTVTNHSALLPQYAPETHLGVRDCAGAPCHGSQLPVGEHVDENEYSIWYRRDPHAGAYRTLRSQASAAIARNYGLKEQAYEAAVCLDCHADNAQQHVEGFRVEDGVACEACHGGSGRWIKTHASRDRRHAENLAEGMYPTDQPLERATLCLSCHFGTSEKWVGHRMLGAGHPRLRFELDSYQIDQPAHFTYDEDYRSRGKAMPDPVRLWAIGQTLMARALLVAVADPVRNRNGIWPEFALMDCYTCHHTIQDERRDPSKWRGLQKSPGTPRLNDSALMMVRHILASVDPKSGRVLREETRTLHRAISAGRGDSAAIASRLVQLMNTVVPELERWQITSEGIDQIAISLIDEGLQEGYRDYPSAEQAVSAIQSLADSRHRLDPYDSQTITSINQQISHLLEATKEDESFSFKLGIFAEALREVRKLLG